MKQTEFDKLMNQLYREEKLEKKDLESRLERLGRDRAELKLEMSELKLRLSRMNIEMSDLAARVKEIRAAYHDRRHELICRWHEEGEYAHPAARADSGTVTDGDAMP